MLCISRSKHEDSKSSVFTQHEYSKALRRLIGEEFAFAQEFVRVDVENPNEFYDWLSTVRPAGRQEDHPNKSFSEFGLLCDDTTTLPPSISSSYSTFAIEIKPKLGISLNELKSNVKLMFGEDMDFVEKCLKEKCKFCLIQYLKVVFGAPK